MCDIPLAAPGPSTSSKVKSNTDAYEKMRRDSPALKLTLYYKMEVLKPRGAADVAEYDRLRGSEKKLWWPKEEVLYLHDVANHLLQSFASNKERDDVFFESRLIFQAIHIMAMGLRGVVCEVLGKDVTAHEKAAKMGMLHEKAGKIECNKSSCRQGTDVRKRDADRDAVKEVEICNSVLMKRFNQYKAHFLTRVIPQV